MAKQEEQKQKVGLLRWPKRSATRSQTLSPSSPDSDAENTAPNQQLWQPRVPQKIQRRQFLIVGAGAVATAAALGAGLWTEVRYTSPDRAGRVLARGDLLAIHWNSATLQAIRDLQPAMPVAARALAIVHTCMFDAWAAYDRTALSTRLGVSFKRPVEEHTLANKGQAVSYAAYRALTDLFPAEQKRFHQLMVNLGYDPADHSTHTDTPNGIGNTAAQAVLDFRHYDGANQLGDLYPGAYADYTQYQPQNTADSMKDPSFWQPLHMSEGRGIVLRTQQFECAQWANVTPFALPSAMQLVPKPGPALYPSNLYTEQAQQILQYSADLTDEQKIIAEYWANGPSQEEPPGHWCLFAQYISQRDTHTLDQNVKMFFILANALLDTSIACWATKRAYSSAYPFTAIHTLFKAKQVRGWAGTGRGVQLINGQYWLPYQPLTALAPAFPEYCSEQSAFSAAAAGVLRHFTGSDRLNTSYTQPAHSSRIESNVPATSMTLFWRTFSEAAHQAGLAGRYSGTHFTQSDLDGRALGDQIGEQVWQKAQGYIHGTSRT